MIQFCPTDSNFRLQWSLTGGGRSSEARSHRLYILPHSISWLQRFYSCRVFAVCFYSLDCFFPHNTTPVLSFPERLPKVYFFKGNQSPWCPTTTEAGNQAFCVRYWDWLGEDWERTLHGASFSPHLQMSMLTAPYVHSTVPNEFLVFNYTICSTFDKITRLRLVESKWYSVEITMTTLREHRQTWHIWTFLRVKLHDNTHKIKLPSCGMTFWPKKEAQIELLSLRTEGLLGFLGNKGT